MNDMMTLFTWRRNECLPAINNEGETLLSEKGARAKVQISHNVTPYAQTSLLTENVKSSIASGACIGYIRRIEVIGGIRFVNSRCIQSHARLIR